MNYPKPEKKVQLKKKSESKLMRIIAKIPVVPKSFMSRFWTTIGHTINTPTKFDDDKDWGSDAWIERYRGTWDHENIHIWREEQLPPLVYKLAYVGPSAPLALVLLFLLALTPILGTSWWIPGGVGIATGAFLPLSVGLAYGRWAIEREAYLVQMDRARAKGYVLEEAAQRIAESLWKNYFFTWPRGWAAKWLVTEAKKRA